MRPVEPKGLPVVPFRNDSGETIPAYAVIKISNTVTETSGDQSFYIYKGEKPDATTDPGHPTFFINGPIDVADGDNGYCYVPIMPVWARYDAAGTPTVAAEWGPGEDSWELESAGTGFYIVSSQTTGETGFEKVLVIGVSAGCDERNEFWQITVTGSPTGGTFDIDLTIDGTTDTLTFNYNSTAAQFETELETHTNIANGDVDVTGGDFPDITINVEFTGNLANSYIPAPVLDFSSLTGGSGVSVVVGRYQPGYPNDAS